MGKERGLVFLHWMHRKMHTVQPIKETPEKYAMTTMGQKKRVVTIEEGRKRREKHQIAKDSMNKKKKVVHHTFMQLSNKQQGRRRRGAVQGSGVKAKEKIWREKNILIQYYPMVGS